MRFSRSIALTLLLSAGVLTGCGAEPTAPSEQSSAPTADAAPEPSQALPQGLTAADPQSEFDVILENRPVYNYLAPGLCYANYIDFDHNGTDELLLITLNSDSPFRPGKSNKIEVYGNVNGHAEKYGEALFQLAIDEFTYENDYLYLVQSGDQLYLETSECDFEAGHSFNGVQCTTDYTYYGVENGQFIAVDHLRAEYHGEDENGSIYQFLSFGQPITSDQYRQVLDRYTHVSDLVWASHDNIFVCPDRGILPEHQPEQVRRSLAYLDILCSPPYRVLDPDEAHPLQYAKLQDFNQDGQEDLILVTKQTVEGWGEVPVFTGYVWDGTAAQKLTLDQFAVYPGSPRDILRDPNTQKVYVRYEDLYDTGASSTLKSADDTLEFEYYETYPETANPTPDEVNACAQRNDEVYTAYMDRVNSYEVIASINPEGLFGNTGFYDDTIDDVVHTLAQQIALG